MSLILVGNVRLALAGACWPLIGFALTEPESVTNSKADSAKRRNRNECGTRAVCEFHLGNSQILNWVFLQPGSALSCGAKTDYRFDLFRDRSPAPLTFRIYQGTRFPSQRWRQVGFYL